MEDYTAYKKFEITISESPSTNNFVIYGKIIAKTEEEAKSRFVNAKAVEIKDFKMCLNDKSGTYMTVNYEVNDPHIINYQVVIYKDITCNRYIPVGDKNSSLPQIDLSLPGSVSKKMPKGYFQQLRNFEDKELLNILAEKKEE